MERLNDYRTVFISEFCDFERAKKGKVYPAGSICVQVSATKGQTAYLEKDQEVDSKYCVFTFKKDCCTRYIYIVFCQALPEFLHRVQTGLNIVPEVFLQFQIPVHNSRELQEHIVACISSIDAEIRKEEEYIESAKMCKKIHLQKMFI